MKATFLLLAAIGAQACQRDRASRSHSQPFVKRQTSNATFPPVLDANEQILIDSFDNTSISTWSYYYTHGDHIAGRNKTIAQWTADKWTEYGFTSRLDEYYVFLNYPVSNSLVLTYPNGSTYKPTLREAVLAEDDTTSYPNSIPSFHGYSFTGNASAEYVYVGRGQQVDFARLVALGVKLEGKIALAKYGGPFRGLKVKNAQDYGMIGAVIFTDPGDDGNVTEVKGFAAYPNGPARNPSTIQRGSVEFLSVYPGDPTTPGYASKPDSPRADHGKVTPKIPSLPISWAEAQPLLQALNGHGPSNASVNRTGWTGAISGVTYSAGPSSNATLFLSNVMNDTYSTIWDAIGVINGTSQDEVVIVGNHRDAWIIGGAADPNSGSAVLIELAKAFSKLAETGWKPVRTIVLASWDAEEYGLVGSTEWVEEHIPWLKNAAVSYLNIDVAVSGPIPAISATPDLHAISTALLKKIVYPYRNSTTSTLYDVWEHEDGKVGVLGSGSDYTAFLHRGIASIDVGAEGGPNDAVYPYHSNYDSYHWMATYGDKGFLTHKAIGQYFTLLLYHFVNDATVPLEPAGYVPELHKYLTALNATVSASNYTIDLSPLTKAISTFDSFVHDFEALRSQALKSNDTALLTVQNHKARDFSRGFASQGGLPTREFFQHTIFAPGRDTGYAPVTFPGVTESITFDKNATLAQEWVGKTAKAILVAASILKT
ncbi:N-acetylated-alpha-linked acidic dipeptidase-like protein 2 [Cucurbitaria berberidis CBS 394.84]|uniref:N-acetylated-alpha-linked acidic dipeptidase-like protein 2 n=1 Tax=Cucurbitaria berberidis CBS 394.84 TaxID=1168544 RepID=A0A9P4GVP8_9PLEO|nr:N-acetylated-alpha-linked acidic dipeptidase-like protein 2 [Cucurbitaria berberidis CBS 394.84]KAF1852144.1 N-acetylated-alpha-linked acidic dipeptidase-like protein 2 [Cucurbitaria berberidis CBS 394.84]